ncbi:MAG: hypothetical protein O7H41_03945 [Planctomycetota bacterium]|nr:hypothetical protein [Planctomycetota bacterium]
MRGRLRLAAWIALGTHFIAGAAMAILLRPGLETEPDLASRMEYVTEHGAAWVGGWLCWTVAALSIIYFYTTFALAYRSEGGIRATLLRIAIGLGIVAVTADILAQTIEIGILPELARARADLEFLLMHRRAVLLTGYLANGLYTISAILLASTTRRFYPSWVWLAGTFGVGVSGVGLSVAALIDSVAGMVTANALLVPAILCWLVGVATKTEAPDRLETPAHGPLRVS